MTEKLGQSSEGHKKFSALSSPMAHLNEARFCGLIVVFLSDLKHQTLKLDVFVAHITV